MSNKRITELVPITAPELVGSDLFPVADISVPETKKVTLDDLALWVASSASLSIGSSSFATTASYLLYTGTPNGTASFAISSSWARLAFSASFVISASLARSASYARTASFLVGTISGAFSAQNADTASYLNYVAGRNTGTASFALTASRVVRSDTASFVNWAGGTVNNGTVFNSISASYARTASILSGINQSLTVTSSWATNSLTASFLKWSTNNGSASWAQVTPTASEAAKLRATTNASLFREWGPLTSSIIGTTLWSPTASFGFVQITGSNAKIIVEVWGNVWMSQSYDVTYSGSIQLFLSESATVSGAYYTLDDAKLQNYYTGSDWGNWENHLNTGSIITRVYLKGSALNPGSANRFEIVARARNASFSTGSETYQGVRCTLKVNTDNVFVEQ